MVEHFKAHNLSESGDKEVTARMRTLLRLAAAFTVVLGVYFRLDHITSNQLFYYDEGHYLTIHRVFDEMLAANPPKSPGEFLTIMKYNLFLSLKTGKGLWFFLSHLRGFAGAFDAFFFPRLMASLFGIATLGVVYLFAKAFYGDRDLALSAAALLAILPSHIFYSRLGLQETLSALCLLAGFYFYLFPRKFGIRTILAGVFFALAYFSNYRMFIIPGLVAFVEAYQWFVLKEKIIWRRFVWCLVSFAMLIVALGSLDDAGHLRIIFFWMLRQGEQAQGHFHWVNFLSYPYAVFKLEGAIFAMLFFAGIGFFFMKERTRQLPLALSLFLMLIFSLAHEKGVRYLVVVMPFMAMSVAYAAHWLARRWDKRFVRALWLGAFGAMAVTQIAAGYQIKNFRSDYFNAVEDIKAMEAHPKIMTSQPYVQGLKLTQRTGAVELPQDFQGVAKGFVDGYQYIVICPQAYVSHTKSRQRFDTALEEHLSFALENIEPVRIYEHFSPAMLERFVLEHNVNLKRSLAFLKFARRHDVNRLKVYRTSDYVQEVFRRLQIRNALKSGGGGG
jgi:hypothetical protein